LFPEDKTSTTLRNLETTHLTARRHSTGSLNPEIRETSFRILGVEWNVIYFTHVFVVFWIKKHKKLRLGFTTLSCEWQIQRFWNCLSFRRRCLLP